MHQNPLIEKAMRLLETDLKKVLSTKIGEPMKAEQWRDAIYSTLAFKREKDQEHIKFIVSIDGDKLSATACNLFTLLAMNGIYVSYHLVKDAEQWTTHMGVFKCIEINEGGKITYKNTLTPGPFQTITVKFPITLTR